MLPTGLYIVSTPIGNLADMTFRAVDVLRSVDLIAAEDTRHSRRLLSHFEIQTQSISLHDHNESDRIEKIMRLLKENKSIALISDAGTPLISDPGFKLVRAVREAGFQVIPIPGACALISGLVVSGMPTDKFIFEGFLPVKTTALEKYLKNLETESRTMIFYESSHRILNTLTMMQYVLGDHRIAVIARELTKTFETIRQDNLYNLRNWIQQDLNQQKGEFVIILKGLQTNNHDINQDALKIKNYLEILLRELPLKQAVLLTCELTNVSRKIVYAAALNLKNQ